MGNIKGEYKIYCDNELVYEGNNTITKGGRTLIADALTSGSYIDRLWVSSEANSGVETYLLDNTVELDIDNKYFFVDLLTNSLV